MNFALGIQSKKKHRKCAIILLATYSKQSEADKVIKFNYFAVEKCKCLNKIFTVNLVSIFAECVLRSTMENFKIDFHGKQCNENHPKCEKCRRGASHVLCRYIVVDANEGGWILKPLAYMNFREQLSSLSSSTFANIAISIVIHFWIVVGMYVHCSMLMHLLFPIDDSMIVTMI